MKRFKKIIKKNPTDNTADQSEKRITNDNLAQHREEIIGAGRKFKYPLAVTKNRLVAISLMVALVAVIVLFTTVTVLLYKTQSTAPYLQKVTRVVPFPIARIGSDFVSYEDYLFEVNHYAYYYKNQQKLDFNSESGKEQIKEYKKRAFDKIINDAYVKQIAEQNNITVSDKEVDQTLSILKSQNRLGASDEEFQTTLREYWDWSVNDFKRSLRLQILNQKVLEHLDKDTRAKADDAYSKLQSGTPFDQLATQVSEDSVTKSQGGLIGLVDKSNKDISPFTVDAIYKLQPAQYSKPINIGYGLEIVRNNEKSGDKIKASHIVFNFKAMSDFLNPIKEQNKARLYISNK
ncbi:MAG: SurA N-terminal domain-containing protein [Patescibacteria group bacterium]